MKKFLIYALSLCAIISCLQEERSPEEILVPTLAQVESSESSLMMTSKVPKGSEKLVDECGFYYSTDESMAHAVKVEASMDSNNFAAELPERNYGTTYYICSYVTNGHGSEIRSEVSSYSLKALDKYIQFEPIELLSYDKTETSAEVTFDVEIWSGVKVSEIGVCFGVTTSPATEGRHVKGEITEEGPVSVSLDKYMTDKEYYLRAYVRDGDYTAYGEVTPLTIKLFPPTLSSVIVSSVKSSSATFSSAVTDDGGDKVTEVGFYYSTEESVDPETSFKVNQVYSSESFSLEATNLQANTNYYVKSFAVNSVGVAYSEVASFMTAPGAPQVATLEATDVTESSAVLSGNVISDNGAEITERGFVWLKGMDVPTVESNKLKAEGTTGEFTAILSDIEPNQKYSFRAYAINSEGTTYGDVMTFSTSVAMPVLAAVEVSNVTSTSATFSSKVLDHGGSTVTDVGFYYSTQPEVDPSTSVDVSRKYANDAFSIDVTELQIFTKYYVKAYTKNAAGTAYSEVMSFTTDASTPVVNTIGSSDVTAESVKLSGTVVTDNGAKITERGFVWLLGEGSPTLSAQKEVVDGTTGDFTVSLNGLSPNQKYSFRAYATNAKGTTYGAVMTFSTVKGLPSVSAATVSNITSTSATFSGKVESHGGETVSDVGFYYNTDPDVNEGNSTKVELKYSNDDFSVNVSDLAVFTKYYVRTYVKNSVGISYGTIVSFTTDSSSPVVTTVGSSDITSSSATLSGAVVTDNGASITERGFVWVKGTDAPTTSSSKIKVDGTIGEYSASLSDIEPNQKYSFRAYAVNSVGTSYGEVMYFTTVADRPTLSVTKVTGITETSATFTSKVTSDGGSTPTEVGFYYSKEESVNIETAQKVSEAFSSDNFTLSVSDFEVGTSYYVKAFALNSTGEAYNDIVSFKTVSTAPSVQTTDASDISSSGAMLSGEVLDDNGEPISERGFVWIKGQGTPAASSNKVNVDETTGEYSATISGLEPNQTYSYRAYAANSKGTAYGETKSFVTLVALPEVEYLSASDITSSSAVVTAKVTAHGGETVSEVGFLYETTSSLDLSTASRVTSAYNIDSFSFTLDNLSRATEYYVRPFATNSAGTSYGETMSFTTIPELPVVSTMDVTDITDNSAVCGGVITDDGGSDIISKGVVWGRSKHPTVESSFKTGEGYGKDSFSSYLTGLSSGRTYYVRSYATNVVGTVYGEEKQFNTTGEIQATYLEAANCFITSSSDVYTFKTVKGNSSESVGEVASAEVLWESFGTSEVPEVGSLISSVSVGNGIVIFEVLEPFTEGNAVIAAKDASGAILWSWHIWLTDQPEEQVYYNNAGTMMDRNLGATSATPGDVGALGLLYQWGRKDPFLGSSSRFPHTEAKSTITWPSAVSSDSSIGTIEYAAANPTTYITYNSSNYDWYYTGSDSTDNTRWQSEKTIYDPCPVGWRVPDGGEDGVWSNALGSSSGYTGTYDSTNEGMDFSGKFGEASAIWYPVLGFRNDYNGALSNVGYYGYYWSVTPNNYYVFGLSFNHNGGVGPSVYYDRAYGFGVRCVKEGTVPKYDNDFSTSGAHYLSLTGNANSYIVSTAGTYSIPPMKGNSSEPVGSVSSAEVLWETFGTDQRVFKGDLISGAKYENGLIYFKTADTYKEGNAVIAAKDASGIVLWSWHIWLTDQPQRQVYYNDAGTMMDRNLGATSATPGDVGALGLLYQWGRKDPFLGSSSISSSTLASSTITWPSAVSSNTSTSTIEYSIANPTTFIYNHSSDDNSRWQSEKTIYDPCPVGWRVPDGGEDGVWSKALGSSSKYTGTYDSSNQGMNFSGKFGDASTIWYPAAGRRLSYDGILFDVGDLGDYWSASPYSDYAYCLYFTDDGFVSPPNFNTRAYGQSVRCLQE